jgi:ABC-2 type transport system ATP-binding protein
LLVSAAAHARVTAISVRDLYKRYGAVDAVNGLSFTLQTGEVLGFLGPNGAGKSTTMKMVAGYVPVSSGVIEVFGDDIQQHPLRSQRRMGYLPEGSPLYGEMTVAEFLGFVASVRGLVGARRQARLDEVVEQLELEIILYQRIETLSKGFKRRVGLAQAVLHDPDLLILDEPTDGLDPNQKFQVRQLIRAMGRSKAIIISTHLLEEVGAVCDRAMVVDRGRIVFDGTPEALRALAPDGRQMRMRMTAVDAERVKAVFAAAAPEVGVEVSADGGGVVTIRPPTDAALVNAISLVLCEAKVVPVDIATESGDLDAVFRQLTAPQAGAA